MVAGTDGREHSERRVGVEIEFSGLTVARAAETVRRTFGGTLRARTDYEIDVTGTALDDFRVEVDVALLKRLGQARSDGEPAPGMVGQLSEDVLAALARQLAPCEIISSPLPFDCMAELDRLVVALRSAGARGTDDALVYAFGVHFNPEPPALDSATVLAHMQAFALLHDWLLSRLDVDWVRRLTPFIRPWARPYVELILARDYAPDLDRLIDDYLVHNPSRNHALDMLPLFAYFDHQRVRAVVDDPRVTARPTFHYRLANCRVGDPHWRLTDEWQSWLMVEALAADAHKRAAMSRDYRRLLRRPWGDLFAEWSQRAGAWLRRT